MFNQSEQLPLPVNERRQGFLVKFKRPVKSELTLEPVEASKNGLYVALASTSSLIFGALSILLYFTNQNSLSALAPLVYSNDLGSWLQSSSILYLISPLIVSLICLTVVYRLRYLGSDYRRLVRMLLILLSLINIMLIITLIQLYTLAANTLL